MKPMTTGLPTSDSPRGAPPARRHRRSVAPERARRRRAGLGLIEILMAVMVFSIMCLPLYQLYFQQGLGQQRMIRDYLAMTNLAEKVLNRTDHHLDKLKRPLSPLHKEVTAQILLGVEEAGDWEFLGQAFNDDSGRMALKYIPAMKSHVEFRGFALDASAVTADQRNANPKVLKAVLDSINQRSQMVAVQVRWVDQVDQSHTYQLKYIRTLRPDY